MDWPNWQMPPPPILSTGHPEAMGSAFIGGSSAAPLGTMNSASWPTASTAIYIPFSLNAQVTVYQLWWYVGATQAGNIDVAIIDIEGNRVISSGSTACGAINVIQELNVTDTVLEPGRYFFGASSDDNTCTVFRLGGTNDVDESALASYVVYEEASAFPIPATITPVVSTAATIMLPCVGAQLRASVF